MGAGGAQRGGVFQVEEDLLGSLLTDAFDPYQGRNALGEDGVHELVDAQVAQERESHRWSHSTYTEEQTEQVTRRTVGEAVELV